MPKFQSVLAAALLAGVALAGTANTARASIQIQIFEDGGAIAIYDSGVQAGNSYELTAGTYGDLIIGVKGNVSATSNSPGGAVAMLDLDNVRLATGTSASGHTFKIIASSDGFTAPVSPPNVFIASTSSLSVAPLSPTVTGAFTSSVGTGLLDTSIQSASTITLTAGASQSKAGDSTSGQFALNGPHALTITDIITFGASGGAVTLTGGNDSVQSVPEPSTVLAALTGLPLLGLGLWRRRPAGRAN